jgi:hypothetical protein
MFTKPPRYYTFILRFWEERNETTDPTWRYSLHDAENDVRYGFTSLGELTAFLEKRVSLAGKATDPPAVSGQQPDNCHDEEENYAPI